MHLVFCYGTLRLGESNHGVIKGAALKESFCWTKGQLYDTQDGYPALVQSEEHNVYGEVYEVDNQLLERINILEGYQEGRDHNLYDCVIQEIESEQGSFEAITYIMKNPEKRFIEIPGGDWIAYRKDKR
ncbi:MULTISPECIES: gamma-glutamylcyclotransferase family protein [Bacillales]|uniref:gamma-glutamylcyclotransferase family protein n=1 Tax=Bacillales TaxID=1385 RepID=UPI001CFD2FB4|nr:gamma-glutamylcyclotransferase family protein [Pseudalkalibacillus hwajinpoensis]WLR58689.1 gamma-glutamylcyclotransferase family protein [Pseudalkalibacillus hwajinpoensis]